MSDIDNPSMRIEPAAASMILYMATVMEDLPAPVRPTIPICEMIIDLSKWALQKIKNESRNQIWVPKL